MQQIADWLEKLGVLSENPIRLDWRDGENHRIILGDVCGLARARNVRRRLVQVSMALEAENLFLRHQFSIALRCAPRLRLYRADRGLLI